MEWRGGGKVGGRVGGRGRIGDWVGEGLGNVGVGLGGVGVGEELEVGLGRVWDFTLGLYVGTKIN